MPTSKEMFEAIEMCLKLDEEFELSEWEENFIINIGGLIKKERTLSVKQVERLESIYDRT